MGRSSVVAVEDESTVPPCRSGTRPNTHAERRASGR
jgi:hypothetical protein